MKENSRCEVQKENGRSQSYSASGAVYHITGGENARAGGMTGFVGYQKSPDTEMNISKGFAFNM